MMLRTALVGTGYWGPNLANSIERTGKAVLDWLCDANPKNLSALARRYPHAKATTDIGEVMHDPRVDALIKSGELGEIYYMSFERTNLGPVRTDVGALWDLASHDASIMCDFMSAAPVSVTAKGHSYLNPGIDDVVFATFI